MKRYFINFFVILLLVVFQGSFLPLLFPNFGTPNIILVFILSLTLILGFWKSLSWIIACGLFFDVVLYNKVGISVIMLILLAAAVRIFGKRILLENKGWGIFSAFVMILCLTLAHKAMVIAYLAFIEKGDFNFRTIIGINLPAEIIFNIIAFFAFSVILRKIFRYSSDIRLPEFSAKTNG